MRSSKGWLACTMALAIGLFVLGSPPQANASIILALQEAGVNGGAITTIATGASFSAINQTGSYGDYTFTLFGASAENLASGSNLLSSVVSITSTVGGTHTLNLFVSETDYTLPATTPLVVRSGMGGTYGSEPGFTAGATFQMWADAANNPLSIPGTFTNHLQTANPASGNGMAFDTGIDPTGLFTHLGPSYSVTTQVSFTTTGLGDVNFSDHVRLSAVPEPGTLLLLGSGLMGLWGIGRRRKG